VIALEPMTPGCEGGWTGHPVDMEGDSVTVLRCTACRQGMVLLGTRGYPAGPVYYPAAVSDQDAVRDAIMARALAH